MKTKDLWRKFEDHLLNEGVSKLRQEKLKTMFNLVSRGLSKPLDKCTRLELEEFIIRLNRNKFVKLDGKEFSGSTKSDIKKFLRQFFKWFKGRGEVYPQEVSWIKSRIAKEERPEDKPVVSIKEIIGLSNTFTRPEYRLLTLLLFDSGFRIQEMLSCQKKDLTWEQYDDKGGKCFWLYCRSSKTEKRKVDVPLFTEDIKNFINSAFFESLGEEDKLFDVSYGYYLRSLKKNSLKTIHKAVTPHCLRHSSATFYAREYEGDTILIGNRYGWSFNSTQMNTYIRRSGSFQRRGAKKVFSNKTSQIEEENKELKEQLDKIEIQLKQREKAEKILDLIFEKAKELKIDPKTAVTKLFK